MSYSVQTPLLPKSEVVEALAAIAHENIEQIDPESQEPSHEHVDQVCELLPQVLEVVGSQDAQVIVSLSGHGNPGHGAREGWADETLTLSISVTEPKEPAAPA